MKTKLVFVAAIVFIFFIVRGSAQVPGWTWAKRAGGTGTDIGYGIAIDKAGYIYTTGEFTSPAITFDWQTLTTTGQADIYLTKHDAYGNLVWAKNFGGIKPDVGKSVVVDGAGNIYITGNFYSNSITFGSYTVTNATTTGTIDDIFLVKLDSSGTPLWAKRAGGTGRDISWGMTTDAFGNIIIGGWFTDSTLTFGSTTLINKGGDDAYIAKYDSNGNPLWAASAGGTGSDYCRGVGADAFGNIFLTGYFGSDTLTVGSATLINNFPGTDDVFVVKYDSSGTQQWVKHPICSGFAQAWGVTGGPNGSVYLTGEFTASLSLGSGMTVSCGAQSDIFLAAYDSNGTALWLKRAGGTSGGNESGQALITDAAGDIYLTGNMVSNVTFDTVAYNSAGGIFVAKYSSAGDFQWVNSAGGSFSYQSNGIVQDVNGGLYVTGYMHNGTTSFGSINLTSAGGQDIIIAKLGPNIVEAVPGISGDNMKIFPNPAQDRVMFSGDKLMEVTIVLHDMTGRRILSQPFSGGTASFDVSSIPRGIYIFDVEGNNHQVFSRGKMIVQ